VGNHFEYRSHPNECAKNQNQEGCGSMNPKQFGKSLLGLTVAVILVSGMAFGKFWSGHKSTQKVTEIKLESQSRIDAHTVLHPGDYRVEIPLNTQTPNVAFMKDGNVVAHVTANVVGEKTKNQETEVFSKQINGEQVITQIRPEGMAEALVFSRSTAAK
jgi:hypothetical protein